MFRSNYNAPTGAASTGSADASNAAPAANFPPNTMTTATLPSQTFGAVRPGTQVTDSEIVLPAQPNVQFSVLHFPEPNSAAKQTDFGKVRESAELLIRREKPAGESKRTAQLGTQPIGMQQGLNLPQAQETAVRKPGRMRTARQVDPNEQPWLLDVKVNAGAKRQQFRGTKQASITENSAYFLLLMGPPNENGRSVFLAHPISEWYTFLPVAQYDHLDEEEAESLFQRRNRIQNFFGIMATRRLERAREHDARDDESASSSKAQSSRDEYAFLLDDDADKKSPFGGSTRGAKRGAAAGRAGASEPGRSDLMLLETADFSSSDDDDADADDIKEDLKDEKKPKAAGSSQKGESSKSSAAAKKPAASVDAKNAKRKPAANASVGRWWKREAERRADKSTRRQERARSRKKRIGLADEEHGEMEEGAYDEALEYDEETSDLDYDDVDEESDASDTAPHRVEGPPSDDETGARRKHNPEEVEAGDMERITEERGVQDDDAIRAMNESASEGDEEGNEDAEKDENAAGPSRRRRRGESLSESSSESSSSEGRADSSSSAPSDAELDDMDASNDYSGAAATTSRKRRADTGDEQVIDLEEPVGNGKRGRFADSDSASASNGGDSGALFGGLTAALVASVIGPMPASNTSPTKQGKSNWDHKLEADIRRTLWDGRIALREFLKRIRAVCRKMSLSDQQLAEKISSVMRRLQVRETREGDSVYLELPING